MNTIKTTLKCDCCGAPIDFGTFSIDCPYCNSPYSDFVLNKMEEEENRRKEAKEQAEKDAVVQAYLKERDRLSKLPKASVVIQWYFWLSAFGAHWFSIKEYYRGFMTFAIHSLLALSVLNNWPIIAFFLFSYIFFYCGILTPILIANNGYKKWGIEFNPDIKLKSKKKKAFYQDFKGSFMLISFGIINKAICVFITMVIFELIF